MTHTHKMSEAPSTDEKKKECPHCGKTGHVRMNHKDCDMNPNKQEDQPETERCSYYAQGKEFCDALKDGDCIVGLKYKGIVRERTLTAADFVDDGVGRFVFALFDNDKLLLKQLKEEEVRVITFDFRFFDSSVSHRNLPSTGGPRCPGGREQP